jgi:hypothetical protein
MTGHGMTQTTTLGAVPRADPVQSPPAPKHGPDQGGGATAVFTGTGDYVYDQTCSQLHGAVKLCAEWPLTTRPLLWLGLIPRRHSWPILHPVPNNVSSVRYHNIAALRWQASRISK